MPCVPTSQSSHAWASSNAWRRLTLHSRCDSSRAVMGGKRLSSRAAVRANFSSPSTSGSAASNVPIQPLRCFRDEFAFVIFQVTNSGQGGKDSSASRASKWEAIWGAEAGESGFRWVSRAWKQRNA